MTLKFINSSLKISLLISLILSLIISAAIGISDGLGMAAGTGWMCLNIIFLKHLIENLLYLNQKNIVKFFLLLGIKFPFLYLLGYWLLSSEYVSPLYFLMGFTLVLGVFIVKHLLHAFNFSKAVGLVIFLVATMLMFPNAYATLEDEVPVVPNLFTLLYKWSNNADWARRLHEWDSIIFSIFIASTISIIAYLGARNRKLMPSSFQNFLEWIVEHLQNFIIGILGPEGKKYVPFLGTLFIYILCMNWMTLVPFMKAPTSSINITVAMALCVFCRVQYLNIKNYGFFGFLYHLAGSPKGIAEWIMVPLMLPIEILTQFTRPLTLAFRLFGNVMGEDILIGTAALFGVILFSFLPVGMPLQLPFMFFVLLTGLMQALVFTLLTTIYIMISLSEKHQSEGR